MAGWSDVESFHGASVCYSVGWLWKEDDEGITLVANWSPEDDKGHKDETTANMQYLLKSCIVERKIIRKAQK